MLSLVRPYVEQYVHSPLMVNLLLLLGIALMAVAFYYITKLAFRFVVIIVEKSPTEWDDDLINKRFIKAVSQLTPALMVNWLLPGLFGDGTIDWLSTLTSLYILFTVLYICSIFISNLYDAFLRRPNLKPYAVKGVFQMVKIVLICLTIIVALSLLIGKTPVAILTALGASAAVLMLVFQDIILGLVASIQLTANKMLQRGDWIEDRTHDVNGEVLEITLTAVKVQNWDNSVSTVPPYSLLKGSFKNYQPMRASGGRRVERAIYIDINSVRFCTQKELEQLQEMGWLDGMDLEQAKHTVNLGLLRRYIEKYLSENENVNHDMLAMVRQLEPTQSGLPLELYFFLNTTEWKTYEAQAADIFDHIYALVNHFGLSIFQTPAGKDFTKWKQD